MFGLFPTHSIYIHMPICSFFPSQLMIFADFIRDGQIGDVLAIYKLFIYIKKNKNRMSYTLYIYWKKTFEFYDRTLFIARDWYIQDKRFIGLQTIVKIPNILIHFLPIQYLIFCLQFSSRQCFEVFNIPNITKNKSKRIKYLIISVVSLSIETNT